MKEVKDMKSRLNKLEGGKNDLVVLLTSLAFGGDGSAAFKCQDFTHTLQQGLEEGDCAFSRRAESEGIEASRAAFPGAIILSPDAEDL